MGLSSNRQSAICNRQFFGRRRRDPLRHLRSDAHLGRSTAPGFGPRLRHGPLPWHGVVLWVRADDSGCRGRQRWYQEAVLRRAGSAQKLRSESGETAGLTGPSSPVFCKRRCYELTPSFYENSHHHQDFAPARDGAAASGDYESGESNAVRAYARGSPHLLLNSTLFRRGSYTRRNSGDPAR